MENKTKKLNSIEVTNLRQMYSTNFDPDSKSNMEEFIENLSYHGVITEEKGEQLQNTFKEIGESIWNTLVHQDKILAKENFK